MKSKKQSDKSVTIPTKTGSVRLSGYASESARIYVDVLIEACQRRKISPRDALINTDSYPQLGRAAEIEFAIGWLHGVAEAHELVAEQIYDAIVPLEVAGKKRPAQKVTRRAA